MSSFTSLDVAETSGVTGVSGTFMLLLCFGCCC
jgi:hypothetical protein